MVTNHRLCDNNGGCNASKGYVKCMANVFDDCSIIFPEFNDTSLYIPSNFKLYPCHDSRMKIQKGIDMYRGLLNAVGICVRDHLKRHQYDVVVMDHSITASQLVRPIKASGAKLVTIHHNVERDYWRDNKREHPLTYRIPYLYYAKKAERDCLRYSDVNLTISENDARVFRSWFPQQDIHAHCWGLFEYQPIADKSFPPKTQRPVFVITGSLYFLQSLYPIMDFVERYWPLVRNHCQQAHLIIAGRNPHPMLLKQCSADNSITIIANPDNMAEVVSQASYYICPISAGSGVKLRILDGLRQGLPVLCHKVSAAGYDAFESARTLFSYDDTNSFSQALKDMLATQASPDTVYQTYQSAFSCEKGIEKLRQILEQEKIIE